MAAHMLSTADNPFNPFTQFDEWHAYDQRKGYHTLAYLARVLNTSDELSEADQSLDYEKAIDEIMMHNLLGNYIRVVDPSGTDSVN